MLLYNHYQKEGQFPIVFRTLNFTFNKVDYISYEEKYHSKVDMRVYNHFNILTISVVNMQYPFCHFS